MAKIDKSYHKLLNEILKKGYKYEDPNRKDVHRIEIPSYQIKHDFKDGFPAITTKKLYWKGIVGELLWFLRGDTNIKYLLDNNINIWNKDAYNYYCKNVRNPLSFEIWLDNIKSHNLHETSGDLGRVYGSQWRNFMGYADNVDQFSNLIKGLKKTPMGTKHIVTAWNPAELEDMALPPCHWSFEILVEPIGKTERLKMMRDLGATWNIPISNIDFDKLCKDKWKIPFHKFTLKWHQRSVDTFLGLIFNIASYALLAQIIGKLTNMKPKGIIGDLSNVHIYEEHLDAIDIQLSRDVNKHDNCELDIKEIGWDESTEDILDHLMISDFKLKNYTSEVAIPARMLPYNK
jgi:thymidylate synthase